jgi:hypothetical protein
MFVKRGKIGAFNVPLPELSPEIDLNDNEQLNLLDSFEPFYHVLYYIFLWAFCPCLR